MRFTAVPEVIFALLDRSRVRQKKKIKEKDLSLPQIITTTLKRNIQKKIQDV